MNFTPGKLIPSEAISDVSEDIGKALIAKASHLTYEADEVTERWEQLQQIGGQRDDHAAALMMLLEPHLRDIAEFAETCRQQLIAMGDDPFGRKDG